MGKQDLERKRELRQQKINSNICVDCSNPTFVKTICEGCSARRRISYHKRKASQQCTTCSKPSCASRCVECRKREINSRLSKKQNGLCGGCANLSAIGNYCQQCWLKKISVKATGTAAHWQSLLEKFHKQNGQCAYTGIKLKFGYNASVDHITPKSRNGSSELSNLQWTTIQVNRVKNDLTNEEFFDLCELVLKHRVKEGGGGG